MALLPPSGFRRGFADLMNAYNSQRVGAGTVAMGVAAGALELALDWVKTREQFGRPIGEFQGLQWMLADMQTQLTASRLMLYQAARSRGPDGSAFPDPMLAAQAKIFASESAIKIVNDALQMFGARGYSRDLPLERMARDVRMFTIGGGTAQVLRTLVASKMLGWKLPQTPRRLCAETLAARRGGVTMHPIFATAGESRRCRSCSSPPPISTQAIEKRRRARARLRAGGRLRAQGRASICWCRRPTASWPACCSASKTPTSRPRTCSGRARSPALLPAGTYRFANAPHDARLAALAFALGAYQFTRYRKARGAQRAAGRAGRRRWRGPRRASPRASTLCARPHQHAVERHGAGRARRRGAQRWPSSTAPRSTSSSGDEAGARISR